MDESRRAEIERKGGTVATIDEWLNLDHVDREVIELRVRVAREIRRRRAELGLTQAEFAARIGCSQPRVAKIENGAGVSLDRMLGAYFALGAKVDDLAGAAKVGT
jgi:DNA-binding XRE family transcriptional regulator